MVARTQEDALVSTTTALLASAVLLLLVLLLWLWDDLQLEFLSVNPVIYLGLFFLLLALAMKKLAGMDKVALIMVSIPGLLLGIMALFLLIVLVINTYFGPIRCN